MVLSLHVAMATFNQFEKKIRGLVSSKMLSVSEVCSDGFLKRTRGGFAAKYMAQFFLEV